MKRQTLLGISWETGIAIYPINPLHVLFRLHTCNEFATSFPPKPIVNV